MKKIIIFGIIMILALTLLTGCQPVGEDQCSIDSDCPGSQLCCPDPIDDSNPSRGHIAKCEVGPICP